MKEKDIAQNVGRGTVYITAAKLYFIASGYGIYLVLPRLFSPAQFGVYGVVISVVSIINAVLVTGTQQTVSKFVSQDPQSAMAVKRQALKIQTLIGGGLSLIYLLSAPLIARAVDDPTMVMPLRVSTLIPLAYSFYAIYIGYLNGQQKFFQQAVLDISYSTLKLLLIVILVLATHNVLGAILGFGLAALLVLFFAPFIAGKTEHPSENTPSIGTLLRFQSTLLGSILVSNILARVDLLLLKKLGSPIPEIASQLAGYYTAQSAIAGVTYQAIVSIAFVIFPLISQASFQDRRSEVQDYIRQTVKYTFIFMAFTATIFSANATAIMGIVYRKEYLAGASALTVSAYGMLFFGMLFILTTIISSSGRPKISMIISSLSLIFTIVLDVLLIPRYGMMGAAWGTSLGILLGVIGAGGYILATFGRCIDIRPLAVTIVAAIVCYPIGFWHINSHLPLFAVKGLLQTLSYIGILILFGELSAKELDWLKRLLPTK